MQKRFITIDGITYDVTNFKHPGGQDNLIKGCNSKNATSLFYNSHPINSMAYVILEDLPNNGKTYIINKKNDKTYLIVSIVLFLIFVFVFAIYIY